jgi:5-methylcytosine-specific restriction endonuclease McrA
MRICSGPGCLRAVPEDVRFCDECAPEHKQDRPSGARRAADDVVQAEYQKARWRKGIRPRVMQRYPFCCECKRYPSAVADHHIPARLLIAICRAERIFPFDPMGGFYILENIVGLCHSCHNSKTKSEDARDWTAELDALLTKFRKKKTL